MARYYEYDLARWEGEGGSPGELTVPSHDAENIHDGMYSWHRGEATRSRGPTPSRRARGTLWRSGPPTSGIIPGHSHSGAARS
jgi:hypothetical protein